VSFTVNFPSYPHALTAVNLDSLPTLRAYDTSALADGFNAITDGGAVSGDGHGSLYVWKPLVTSVDNGATVIQPTGVASGSPGRWVAVSVGASGAPGGNIMAVGLFSGCAGMSIPSGTEAIRTSGYSSVGQGGGEYIHDGAVDAAFVAAHPTWSFIAGDGRGFRLNEQQTLWFEMFGGVGDAAAGTGVGTDNLPAWLAARDFIHYFRTWPSGNYYYKPSVPLNFRAKNYYFSDAIDLTDAAYVLRGAGNGGYGLAATWFMVAAGKCGMLFQSWDTQGTTGTQPNINTQPYNHGASSSYICDIVIQSLGGTVGAFQHGFVLKSQVMLERCFAVGFGGDGFHIAADVNTAGNANAWKLKDCGAQNCGLAGLYLDGGDGNAGYSIGFQAFRNGTWGIWDSSFLGNHHFFFQTDGNGVNFSGPSWASSHPSTFCNFGGHVWRVVPGQHVAASTTTPGTNSAVWVDWGTGSTTLGPTWVSGMTWVTGGAYYADDQNARCVFAGYAEGDQASAWFDSKTSFSLPGFSSPANSGALLQAVNSGVVAGKIGSQSPGATAGNQIIAQLGEATNFTNNTFFRLGNTNNAATPWVWSINESQQITQLYNGAGGSNAYVMSPPGFAAGMGFPRGIAVQNSLQYSGTAAPTTGTYTVGNIVWNTTPTAGGKVGWICVTAGTPGTWKSFGAIDP
jgi:hypothetical protein